MTVNNRHSQSELIKIGQEHFNKIILPQLMDISAETVNTMLVFIEGSVSYGFCDSHSDIDIDYYINSKIDPALANRINKICNTETYWHESVRVSYGFGGDYWKIDLVLKNDMDRFWKEFNPYAVNNLKQAIAVWDPKSLMPIIQDRVRFYPIEMKRKVLRGLWITLNDSGEYNTRESIKRNNHVEARIYLFRAIEAMLRIVYILNNRYYPPTKWLSTGLSHLDIDFGVSELAKAITADNNINDILEKYMKAYNVIKEYMLEHQAIEKECLENYSATFQRPFFIFNTF